MSHECRPPVPWLFGSRNWRCRCGQRWHIRRIRRNTPQGEAIAEATPIGGKR